MCERIQYKIANICGFALQNRQTLQNPTPPVFIESTIIQIITIKQMQNMQQTVFQNLNSGTQYNFSSKKLTEKHALFPKYRYQELQNQFELVDLHNTGYLSEQQIINYLSDKYEWINSNIIRSLFKTMEWTNADKILPEDPNSIIQDSVKTQYVTKEQFCQKYLEKQKKLYHEVNGLKFYANWVKSLEEIYHEEVKAGVPRSYFYVQVKKIELYYQQKAIQWMDLRFIYQNHDKKVEYEIEEASHEANHHSFQVWLPSQKDHFFLKLQFLNIQSNHFLYGQSFFNIELEDKMQKKNTLQLPIMKAGKKVGNCQIAYRLQPSLEVVREQIEILKQKQPSYKQIIDEKAKQYEYLQFLWGIRHISPHKVSKVDVFWVVLFRIVLAILLGIIGVLCNVLGRCQPISIILSFIIIQNCLLVMLRQQKFYLTWMAIAGIFLDLVWLSIASDSKSQINFIELGGAQFLTYPLLVIKVILFVYMLFYEKALTSRQASDR